MCLFFSSSSISINHFYTYPHFLFIFIFTSPSLLFLVSDRTQNARLGRDENSILVRREKNTHRTDRHKRRERKSSLECCSSHSPTAAAKNGSSAAHAPQPLRSSTHTEDKNMQGMMRTFMKSTKATTHYSAASTDSAVSSASTLSSTAQFSEDASRDTE